MVAPLFGDLVAVKRQIDQIALKRFTTLMPVAPDIVKVGAEGYIHGFICVRPPCGKQPDKLKASDLSVKRDGTVVHKPSGYAVGHIGKNDAGKYVTSHSDAHVSNHKDRSTAVSALASHYNSGKTKRDVVEEKIPVKINENPVNDVVDSTTSVPVKSTDDAKNAAISLNAGKLPAETAYTRRLHHDIDAYTRSPMAGISNAMREAVIASPSNAPSLYRGIQTTKFDAATHRRLKDLTALKPGDTFDHGIGSWSSRENISGGFSGRNKPVEYHPEQERIGVILKLEPGAQALQLEPYAALDFKDQAEWLSGGSLQVTGQVTRDKRSGVFTIPVRQVPNSIEKESTAFTSAQTRQNEIAEREAISARPVLQSEVQQKIDAIQGLGGRHGGAIGAQSADVIQAIVTGDSSAAGKINALYAAVSAEIKVNGKVNGKKWREAAQQDLENISVLQQSFA